MATLPKRPASVWISQIILLLLDFAFTILLLLSVLFFYGPQSGWEWFWVSIIFGFVVIASAASVGLALRKAWGQWLAVVFLLFLALLLVAWPFLAGLERVPTGLFLAPVIGILLGLHALNLGFSETASQFFSGGKNGEEFPEPPPPPTFAG